LLLSIFIEHDHNKLKNHYWILHQCTIAWFGTQLGQGSTDN